MRGSSRRRRTTTTTRRSRRSRNKADSIVDLDRKYLHDISFLPSLSAAQYSGVRVSFVLSLFRISSLTMHPICLYLLSLCVTILPAATRDHHVKPQDMLALQFDI